MSCSLVQCPKIKILLSELPFLLVWCLWLCSMEQNTPEPGARAAPQPCMGHPSPALEGFLCHL